MNNDILLDFEKILATGHDLECICCGLKDRIATEAIKKWEAEQSNQAEDIKPVVIWGEPLREKPTDNWPRGDDAVWEYDTVLKMKSELRKWEDSSGKETGMRFWTEEMILRYAELYRWSSGRITMKGFKDSTKWQSVDIKEAKEFSVEVDESVPPYKEEETKEFQCPACGKIWDTKSSNNCGHNVEMNHPYKDEVDWEYFWNELMRLQTEKETGFEVIDGLKLQFHLTRKSKEEVDKAAIVRKIETLSQISSTPDGTKITTEYLQEQLSKIVFLESKEEAGENKNEKL